MRKVFVLFLQLAAMAVFLTAPSLAAEPWQVLSIEGTTAGSFDTPCVRVVCRISSQNGLEPLRTKDFSYNEHTYRIIAVTPADADSETCELLCIELPKQDQQPDAETEAPGLLMLLASGVAVYVSMTLWRKETD